MTDEFGQVRPEREDYLKDVTTIQRQIERGGVLYVEHAENMTSHRLLIVPGRSVAHLSPPWGTKKYNVRSVAFFYEDHRGPVFAHTDGSDWVHWTYVAEKFGIDQYRDDCVSLANFINRILGWGDDKMQKPEEAHANA